MPLMGDCCPHNIDCRFKMLSALVQKIYVCRVFDVRRCHRGIHNQFAPVLFSGVLFLGYIGICLASYRFSASGALWRLTILIVMVIVLVFRLISGFFRIPVNAPARFRPFPRTDIFIDLGHILHRETLSEMHHHGCVEQRLLLEFMQPKEVLHIRIFLDCGNAAFISQILGFLDVDRAKGNTCWDCFAPGLCTHGSEIDFFNLIPRHD